MRDESAARIPILIIYVVPTIRCIAAGALTGSVRVHAATSRRSRIGGARCCSASCACRSTSATGTSSRSAAGATGATTSRSAATTAAALCQRGRTDGDCCKQRKSEYFSYRHAGLHVGVSFMKNRQPTDCSGLGKRQLGPTTLIRVLVPASPPPPCKRPPGRLNPLGRQSVQLCGSALWWRACCRSRNPLQAGPFDDESPVPPAGLLFGAGRLCNQPASRPVDMVCSDWWGAARPLGPFEEVAPPPAPRLLFRSDGVQHSDATLA